MKKKIIVLLLLILAGGGAFFLFRPENEAAKVKKVLQTLCRMATKRTGDNPAASALMISKTDKIFAGEFSVKIGNGMFDGIYNPTKMTADLARYRAVFTEVEVDAQDMEITFPAQDTAEAVCTGVLKGRTRTGSGVSEAREVICTLLRTQDGWRINKLEIKEIMQR